MVKASWGTKRTCQNCAARFYDLNKGPIKCPKCGREHDREDFVKVRRGRGAAAAAAAAAARPRQRRPSCAGEEEEATRTALAGDESGRHRGRRRGVGGADDLADEAEDIEVEGVEDDKGEGDR